MRGVLMPGVGPLSTGIGTERAHSRLQDFVAGLGERTLFGLKGLLCLGWTLRPVVSALRLEIGPQGWFVPSQCLGGQFQVYNGPWCWPPNQIFFFVFIQIGTLSKIVESIRRAFYFQWKVPSTLPLAQSSPRACSVLHQPSIALYPPSSALCLLSAVIHECP